MFSDYKLLAVQYNSEIEEERSVPCQAHKYYELIKYVSHLSSYLKYDITELYDMLKAEVFEKFQSSSKRYSTNRELDKLVNYRDKTQDYYHQGHIYRPNYDSRELYAQYTETAGCQCSSITSTLSTHLAEVLNEIAKKDCYINYKTNETEEDITNAEYKDKVTLCNNRLNEVASQWLYSLSYEYTTEESELGFRKDVRSLSPLRYNPIINVDSKWFDSVYDHNIQILEYQGSRAYTLSAELVKRDSEKAFYYVEVLQMTGTRDEMSAANWHHSEANMDKIMKTQHLVLSMSTGGDGIWALGSDENWAYRTMKARQKRHMYKQLTI